MKLESEEIKEIKHKAAELVLWSVVYQDSQKWLKDLNSQLLLGVLICPWPCPSQHFPDEHTKIWS